MNTPVSGHASMLLAAQHPAAEPRKKSALKRRNPVRPYPPSPSPESNNLRAKHEAGGLRFAPAP